MIFKLDYIGKACLVVSIQAIVFIIGLVIACKSNKPIGITVMIADVLILYVKLKASSEVMAEQRRRKRYQSSQWKSVEEAHENGSRKNF